MLSGECCYFLQKKKKGASKEEGVAGGVAVKDEAGSTTRNVQELLSQMTVDPEKKVHKFWDTQPVPRLSERGVWQQRWEGG